MPIGSSSVVPFITSELCALRPRNVLDLGCGFGWAGVAVRQWLDEGVPLRGTTQVWRTRLVGVEGFAGYRAPTWDLYDEVHVAAIEEWLAGGDRERWDAILLLDVLEHFERAGGEAVLAAARGRLSERGVLLIATPAIWHPQTAVHGNALETHRTLWTADELRAAGCAILWDGSLDRWGQAMLVAAAGPG